MRFTDKNVKDLKPQAGKQYEVRDETGLVARVSPGGTRTWFCLYQKDKKRYRLKLGTTDEMRAHEARRQLDAVRVQLANGANPVEEIRREHERRMAAVTVSELCDLYLERWARPRKRSWADDERRLRLHVVPRIGDRRASEIRRRDVAELLNQLTQGGMTVGANRVLAVIRRVFNWAVEQDILDSSPCNRLRAPARESSRDRVLNETEIARLWNGLPNCSMSESTRFAIKLQLATALRIGEVVGATWDEIDFESGWWTVPASRSKNGRAHRVPVVPLVRELLLLQQSQARPCRWVFPAPIANAPMTTQAVSKALNRSRAILGIAEPFVPHDLRRTAATHMARAGVPREVVGQILNHTDRSVTAIYVRHSYDPEKRKALDSWALALVEVTRATRGSAPIGA